MTTTTTGTHTGTDTQVPSPEKRDVGVEEGVVSNHAKSSLKRARCLFRGGESPAAVVIPPLTNDFSMTKLAVARRIRMNYSTIPKSFDPIAQAKLLTKKTTETGRIIQTLHKEQVERLKQQGSASLEANDNKRKREPTTTSTALVVASSDQSSQQQQQQQLVEHALTATSTTSGGTTSLSGPLVIHREVDIVGGYGLNNGGNGTNKKSSSTTSLALPGQKVIPVEGEESAASTDKPTGILVKKDTSSSSSRIPDVKWHAPWNLSTVISSHLGWVRSIAFDPHNDMFATGSADRTIKIFDFPKASVGAEDALKLTLTGHISSVRGLAFSDKMPYLFSAGEDKMVKCWDLETNTVVRHYHGHLSGIFCLKLHPTLDLLMTAGRDAVCRVWDIRTKHQVHCLTGHDNTIGSLVVKSTDPQVVTGSYDTTIKLWDLAAGKCMTTLTHHKKAIRALVEPTFERTFVSGAADTLKKFQSKDGRFLRNFTGHNAIINALAVNDDGVLVSGADNGTIKFWDYSSGYCFQDSTTIAQAGSLESENGIYAMEFDLTGTRLITGEADKTIKIWKPNMEASEMTHPIDMKGWRTKCIEESKQRY